MKLIVCYGLPTAFFRTGQVLLPQSWLFYWHNISCYVQDIYGPLFLRNTNVVFTINYFLLDYYYSFHTTAIRIRKGFACLH
jgi:hypothetical protein